MFDDYCDNIKKEHTFLWSIDNYSYCCHKNGEILYSPYFTPFELDTVWRLRFYPRGAGEEERGYVTLCLDRGEEVWGPKYMSPKYVLSILAKDGSILCSVELEGTFKKGEGTGEPRLMDEVLLRRKIDSLSQDTLTICCKMWIGEGNVSKFGKSCARTRIGIQKVSFLHVVKNFSELKPDHKSTVPIRSPSIQEFSISSSTVSFGDSLNGESELHVRISPFDGIRSLFKLRVFLLCESGNVLECGEFDNRFDAERKENQPLPLSLTKRSVIDKKNEYLPNNELSLLIECTISNTLSWDSIVNKEDDNCFDDGMFSECTNGVESNIIEEFQYNLPVVALNLNKKIYNAVQKLSVCSNGLDDFKEIYNNQLFTDVEVRTKTKSFPAHKFVLGARSSVFQAMLTNNMREKNTACIQVDDLEDETVEQLLLFMYSDKLENLQWESAIQLYYAGDKYAVEKLKVICASFLVEKLSASTAGQLLYLSDTHNDSDLQLAVEDFISKHKDEVFGSEEWAELIKTNPKLVMKTKCSKSDLKEQEPDNSARKRRISDDGNEAVKQMKQDI